MKFCVLLGVLFAIAEGFDLHGGISPDPHNFLQKYALIKLYEACFGKEAMYQVSWTFYDLCQ